MIDETTAIAEESGSGLNISVDSVFEGILTVYGFFRQIIDFLKGIFTPMFESLFDSAGGKIDDLLDE